MYTAGSDTIFSHISLLVSSHRSFRNYSSNVAVFLSLKPIMMISDVMLNYLKKSCRGSHHSEISKTNTKTMISFNGRVPRGAEGVKKREGPKHQWPDLFLQWYSARIEKTLENRHKTVIFVRFPWFHEVVWGSLGLNISAKTHQAVTFWFFWHPWQPFGCVYIDLNENSVQSGCVAKFAIKQNLQFHLPFTITSDWDNRYWT